MGEAQITAMLMAYLQRHDPAAAAPALLGAIMGCVGAVHGHRAAAQMLYALADATATRGMGSGEVA